jgi:hypothetical protein
MASIADMEAWSREAGIELPRWKGEIDKEWIMRLIKEDANTRTHQDSTRTAD